MDKDHIIKVFAKGIMKEVTEEAMDLIRTEAAKEGITFSDHDSELMEAGAAMGVAAAISWLYRHKILNDEVKL